MVKRILVLGPKESGFSTFIKNNFPNLKEIELQGDFLPHLDRKKYEKGAAYTIQKCQSEVADCFNIFDDIYYHSTRDNKPYDFHKIMCIRFY